jgi:hypothetical protein
MIDGDVCPTDWYRKSLVTRAPKIAADTPLPETSPAITATCVGDSWMKSKKSPPTACAGVYSTAKP